jgi:hypothetical protein
MTDVGALEDRLLLAELLNRYAFYNDTFDVDSLLGLFVEGASFDMTEAGLERYEGLAAIRNFFERERRALSHLMHLTSNHLVELDGDRATGTAYYLAAGIVRRTGIENQARGYYEDTYVRTGDGWRFASRRSRLFLPFEPVRRPDPA